MKVIPYCLGCAFTVALTFALIPACYSEDPVSPDPTIGEVLPVKEGNQWVYAVEMSDSTGYVIHGRTVTVSIGKDSVVDGVTWYKFPDNFWWVNKSDGWFLRRISDVLQCSDRGR